jgi:hypothetical protein
MNFHLRKYLNLWDLLFISRRVFIIQPFWYFKNILDVRIYGNSQICSSINYFRLHINFFDVLGTLQIFKFEHVCKSDFLVDLK